MSLLVSKRKSRPEERLFCRGGRRDVSPVMTNPPVMPANPVPSPLSRFGLEKTATAETRDLQGAGNAVAAVDAVECRPRGVPVCREAAA